MSARSSVPSRMGIATLCSMARGTVSRSSLAMVPMIHSDGGLRLSLFRVTQCGWQPERAEHAGVEPGHRADLRSGEGEHHDTVGVALSALRPAQVHAERRLAVSPDRYDLEVVARGEHERGQELSDEGAAGVDQRDRRHRQPDVSGQECDELADGPALVSRGEPRDEVALLSRT